MAALGGETIWFSHILPLGFVSVRPLELQFYLSVAAAPMAGRIITFHLRAPPPVTCSRMTDWRLFFAGLRLTALSAAG